MARRIWRWLSAIVLVGAIVALMAHVLRAQEECNDGEGCFVVYYPGICAYLDQDGYWYRIFLCGENNLMALETSTITTSGDLHVTDIRRIYQDGRTQHVLIVQSRKRR